MIPVAKIETKQLITKPFPTYKRFLTHEQQITFEIIVAKGEIAQNEQFLHFVTLFSTLLTKIKPLFKEIVHVVANMIRRLLLYVGKGY